MSTKPKRARHTTAPTVARDEQVVAAASTHASDSVAARNESTTTTTTTTAAAAPAPPPPSGWQWRGPRLREYASFIAGMQGEPSNSEIATAFIHQLGDGGSKPGLSSSENRAGALRTVASNGRHYVMTYARDRGMEVEDLQVADLEIMLREQLPGMEDFKKYMHKEAGFAETEFAQGLWNLKVTTRAWPMSRVKFWRNAEREHQAPTQALPPSPPRVAAIAASVTGIDGNGWAGQLVPVQAAVITLQNEMRQILGMVNDLSQRLSVLEQQMKKDLHGW